MLDYHNTLKTGYGLLVNQTPSYLRVVVETETEEAEREKAAKVLLDKLWVAHRTASTADADDEKYLKRYLRSIEEKVPALQKEVGELRLAIAGGRPN